jgi:uncharacterized membrane protein
MNTTERQADEPPPQTTFAPRPFIIGLCAFPVVFWLGTLILYFIVFAGSLSEDPAVWGQFGDYIGGFVNPVVAVCTLIVVAITLWYSVSAIQISAKATLAAQDQARTSQLALDNELKQQRQRADQEKSEQAERRTLYLHQQWVSPDMQTIRIEAFDVLHGNAHADDPIFLGHLPKGEYADRRLYRLLRAVWEFMANANSMLEAGLLHEQLFWKLFTPSLHEWAMLAQRVRFEEHNDAKSPQADADSYWYGKHVLPLLKRIIVRDNIQGIADQMRLPGPEQHPFGV